MGLDYFKELSFVNTPTMLVIIMGICNLFGRIFFGILVKFPQFKSYVVYPIACFMSGFFVFLFPLASNYISKNRILKKEIFCCIHLVQFYLGIIICCASFGLSIACLGSLTPEVIINCVEKRNLSSGYGIILF
jgi:hypothetical protein